jgi:uncharacterized protein (AIM24 family)
VQAKYPLLSFISISPYDCNVKLLWAIFRWIASRLVIFICIAALVVLSAILKDWWNQRKIQQSEIFRLQNELADLNHKIRKLQQDLSLEKRYLDLHQHEPSRWTSPLQWLRWKQELELTGRLLDRKNVELKKLHQMKQSLLIRIKQVDQALFHTHEVFVSTFKKSVGAIVLITAAIFVGPVLWKAFWYFGVAKLAQSAPPIQLESPVGPTMIQAEESKKSYSVSIAPGERLVTRMDWLHQYAPHARKKTRFLLNWKSPFISYAAGLAELTEVSVDANSASAEVVLSSGKEPDKYLCELRIENHPGLVVYPLQVIAICGNIQLKTRWTLTNPHSWIAGRLRHIILSGTGRVFMQGTGGLQAIQISDGGVRVSEAIVTAFETTLAFSTVRTETFWPYYRQMVPLFDYQFEGRGVLLRQTAPDLKRVESPTIRVFDALLNGIGKLLGVN